jgi:hypothetical protein
MRLEMILPEKEIELFMKIDDLENILMKINMNFVFL